MPRGLDLISLYLHYTKDAPSPVRFRTWAAIHMVGAAAERRIWTRLGINRMYPNIYVWLVGPPGTGKTQSINPSATLLRKSQSVGLSPNDLTKQGLLDALAECSKGNFDELNQPFDYHFMAICISELSNFMPEFDPILAGLLTDLYDCPPINEEKKRSGAGKVIPFPGLSFIMGTATGHLGHVIPGPMWESGFMARVIMVYCAEEIVPEDMFAEATTDEAASEEIATGLRRIGNLRGRMGWTDEAMNAFRLFRNNQKDGAPVHNRLSHYVTRRWFHLGKLCMISALADERMEVELGDYNTAMTWLLDAESFMPEIFKDMNSHEDGQTYQELRNFVFQEYMRTKSQPVPISTITAFLANRVSAFTLPKILEIAEKGLFIIRMAGTSGDDALYRPGDMTRADPRGLL